MSLTHLQIEATTRFMIKCVRHFYGLTQVQMSREIGVGKQLINKVESGNRSLKAFEFNLIFNFKYKFDPVDGLWRIQNIERAFELATKSSLNKKDLDSLTKSFSLVKKYFKE